VALSVWWAKIPLPLRWIREINNNPRSSVFKTIALPIDTLQTEGGA